MKVRSFIGLLLVFGITPSILAQKPEKKNDGDKDDAIRAALLIGVNEYDDSDSLPSLSFCEKDVKDLGEILKTIGFDTIILSDSKKRREKPTKANIERALSDITKDKLNKQDSIIIAFSGHGVTYDNKHYFCPSDAKIGKDNVESLVNLTGLYEQLSDCGAGAKILFVDACRNTPSNKSAKSSKNQAEFRIPDKMPAGVGALFSCDNGQKSYESESYEHSYMFHHLIEEIKSARDQKRNLALSMLSDNVAEKVEKDTEKNKGAKQTPNLKNNFVGRSPYLIYFDKNSESKDKDTLAKNKEGDSKKSENPPPSGAIIVYLDKENKVPLEMIKIDPRKQDDNGTFSLMGPANLKNKEGFENTDIGAEFVHEVTLTKAYWMAKYPITVKQFRVFLESTNKDGDDLRGEHVFGWSDEGLTQGKKFGWDRIGFKQDDDCPVVGITRGNALEFMKFVQKKYERQSDNPDDKRCFRLPTEAEWEYACRAGKGTAYFFGNNIDQLAKFGNFLDPGSKKKDGFPIDKPYLGAPDGFEHTSPVGRFAANGFGLYDMHGNVWQMCDDGWTLNFDPGATDPTRLGEYQKYVAKGGSWLTQADDCRSASREPYAAGNGYAHFGFRPCFGIVLQSSEGSGAQQKFVWKQLTWPQDGKLYWWLCDPKTGVDVDGPFLQQNENSRVQQGGGGQGGGGQGGSGQGGGGNGVVQQLVWQKDAKGLWWKVDKVTGKQIEGPFNNPGNNTVSQPNTISPQRTDQNGLRTNNANNMNNRQVTPINPNEVKQGIQILNGLINGANNGNSNKVNNNGNRQGNKTKP